MNNNTFLMFQTVNTALKELMQYIDIKRQESDDKHLHEGSAKLAEAKANLQEAFCILDAE